MDSSPPGRSVEYESVSGEYLAARQLKRGAAGWVLLAGLGVSYVISGDYAGWNLGLAQGGFGGLLIATLVMGGMYLCLVLSLAELSACLPTAGGGYSFARRVLGPWGGYLTGTAILLEYALAPAAIAADLLAAFGVYVSWTPVLLALLGASFMSVVMTPLLANDPVWNGRVLVCGVLPFSFAVAVPLTDALGVALGYSLW